MPPKSERQVGSQTCPAHTIPIELADTFTTSVSETLRNVFDQIEDVPAPIPGDQVKRHGARGIVIVRRQRCRGLKEPGARQADNLDWLG
jgi:hypothetical protein